MNYNKCVSKFLLFMIINIVILNFSFSSTLACSPEEGKELEIFIEENKGFITSEDQRVLNDIILKLNKYIVLTQDEREYIRECKLNVIRQKLGDVQFEEYKKLIEKRSSSSEFSQEDRLRLYQLEKLLK